MKPYLFQELALTPALFTKKCKTPKLEKYLQFSSSSQYSPALDYGVGEWMQCTGWAAHGHATEHNANYHIRLCMIAALIP